MIAFAVVWGVATAAEPIVIEAGVSVWSAIDGHVSFSDGVCFQRGALKLCAERGAATFDGDVLTGATAEGDVRLEDGLRVATATRASWDPKTEAVVMSGNAVVVEGRRRLSGERIEWHERVQRLACSGCRLEVHAP